MDIEKTLTDIIPESMARRGKITLDSVLNPIKDVLNRRRFPESPLSELQIELLLKVLSTMDTDKDPGAARVGEREGRIASPLIGRLSAGFNHGIGRSGDIIAPQPKAIGASLMQQVANTVAVDAIRQLGLTNIKSGMIAPLSTGMTIALVLSAFRREFGVKRVIFPRIDHSSPSRGIALAGLEEITSPTILDGDSVQTDLGQFEKIVSHHDSLAILATTTFFPPRASDPIKEIAKICQENELPLVINNAYGVQSELVMASLRSAIDAGRVDAVVQSSDKNFLAPVGASIVVSPSDDMITEIASSYAGRATAAPVVQTFAALLTIGLTRYQELRLQQIECRKLLESRLKELADSTKQRVLEVDNTIACAITMDGIDVRDLGARLYNRRVTGPRAVAAGDFGSSIDNYPHSYLVMNAALGASINDVETATTKLYKELSL
ncbi:MAG: O-phosphoseryl-tRNA(Sec) selenium transferase [Candidatus Thorarchaeota archaeon]